MAFYVDTFEEVDAAYNNAIKNGATSVGFSLYDRKENKTESAYTGDYLYYEIIL